VKIRLGFLIEDNIGDAPQGPKVEKKIICSGNMVLVEGEKASYRAKDGKRAALILFSTGEFNVPPTSVRVDPTRRRSGVRMNKRARTKSSRSLREQRL
jgi:hypothetical protein